MNICGCLVHVAGPKTESASAAMATTPGVEVHAQSEDGRFVVVVEDTDTRLASETIMDLHQIPGVLSLTLNYHHFEDMRDTARQPLQPAGGQPHDHL